MDYTNVKLEELSSIAKEIVKNISNKQDSEDGFVIYLEGEMGAGKTTLAQNIGRSLGITDHMQSPTFTLMREYDLTNSEYKNKYKKLMHIDAYRFEDKKEGQVLKINENKISNIVLIEWQSNMYAPDADMIINIRKGGEHTRDISVKIF
jgi:tRNA threonylcarbamoyladenosine biosynthesis protein TsaE